MKLKITEPIIKQVAGSELTYVEGQILLENGAIKEFYAVKVNEDSIYKYKILAYIEDWGHRLEVELQFDKSGDLRTLWCGCPLYGENGEFCRHTVAVLMYAKQQQTSPKKIKWESLETFLQKRLVTELFNEYEESLSSVTSIKYSDEELVQLVPRLRFENNEVHLELQIGRKRLYVVKDIFKFIQYVGNQQEFHYGKELTFNHQLDLFTPESLTLLEFVRGIVEDQQSYADQYDLHLPARRGVFLSQAKLVEFHQLFLGKRLTCLV